MEVISAPAKIGLDIASIRADFPLLRQSVNGKPLIYLDSTSTSQKPKQVIEALDDFYQRYNANIHRGIYSIAEEATARHEEARKKVQKFINAKSWREIVFVRNTTEAINLVAYAWGRANIHSGDEIVATLLEHHSNIVPWQLLAKEKGADLKFIPVDSQGYLQTGQVDTLITEKTKLVAVTMMSNVAGTIPPLKAIVQKAHEVGAITVVDGAQGVPHLKTDVRDMDCDFLAFSGHKMLGPFIGVLYGKRAILEDMNPFLGGGDMIREVHLQESRWNDLPYKFEAGTPAIAEAIGLGVAVDYLSALGMENVRAHDKELVEYALERLVEVPGLRIVGPQKIEDRGGVVAFDLPGIHPHDVATILDGEGICVRAGHHCAMPLHEHYDLAATTRASFYVYNLPEEIDKLVETLYKVKTVFGK